MEAIFALCVIILAIVFAARFAALSSKIETLRRTIGNLTERLDRLEAAIFPVHAEVRGQTGDADQPAHPAAGPASSPPERTAAQEPKVLTPPISGPEKPSRTKEEWEALIGGKLLNRIGALALIIGTGFFLKYAFDNNWIAEYARVSIGALSGILALITAARTSKRGYQIFAQGLVGTGIAILYLSVYASFNFYHLLGQEIAFACMSAVTIVTFTQAFRYNSPAVSLIGWLGGFLTPFLLSTGQANEVGLFTYVALLNLGTVFVLTRKDRWVLLEPLALGGTYVIFGLWFDKYYHSTQLSVTLVYLFIFWLTFHSLDLLRSGRGSTTLVKSRRVFASFHALLFSFAVYVTVKPEGNHWTAAAAFVLALLYLASAILTHKFRPPADPPNARFALPVIIFLATAICLEFEGLTIVTYWGLEALLVFWCGVRLRLRIVWQSAILLFGLATLTLLGTAGAIAFTPAAGFVPIMNQRAFTFLVLIVAMAMSSLLSRNIEDRRRDPVQALLHFGWIFLFVLLLTVETNDYFRRMLQAAGGADEEATSYHRYLAIALCWMTSSLLLTRAGIRQEIRPMFFSGILLSLCAMVLGGIKGIAYAPLERFVIICNERAFALCFLIGGSILLARWLRGSLRTRSAADFGRIVSVATVVLILVLLTGEIRDYFGQSIELLHRTVKAAEVSQQINRLENMKQLCLSSIWLLCSVGVMALGLWRRERGLRIQAMVLFGISILKIFAYDLSFLDTLYRIFSFIGLGMILLIVSYLYQRYRGIILEPSPDSGME